ncbi:GHKL domain-containing protein [Acidaminobacterium chupaoyuni]
MEQSKKAAKLTLALLAGLLLFSGLLLFLYRFDNKYTQKATQPLQGILCLSEQDLSDRRVLFLARQWQYYPGSLLSPEDFQAGLPDRRVQYITVGKYNDFSMGRLSRSPFGSATYRMVIELPQKAQTYSLALPEIYSSYRLFINGRPVLAMGDPERFQTKFGRQTVDFSAQGAVEILLAVSNNSHYYSGLTSPPAFGYTSSVRQMMDRFLFLNAAVMIFILLPGLFSLYLGIRLKVKKAMLHALVCFCLLFYLSYPIIATFFTVSGRGFYILELVATYGIYLLLVRLQHLIFETDTVFYRPLQQILWFFCLLALAYAIYPTSSAVIHALFAHLVFAVKLVTAAYLLGNSLLAVKRQNANSFLLLLFTALFSISLIADRVFPFYEAIYGRFFYEYGGLLLVLGFGYVLWQDLAEAYRLNLTFADEKRRLTMQVAMQKTHYSELTDQIAQAAKQRHDLRHHLRTIYTFLLENDVEQAIDYLSDCDVTKIQPLHTPLCENVILDAILQYYKTLSEEHQIVFQAAVEIPADLPMEDTDLSILFGNLLENAYDACLGCAAPAYIRIMAKYKDTGLLLRIENAHSSPIRKQGRRFLSSKHEGPGIGTESVKAVVSQYHGMITFEHTPAEFRVSAMLSI